MFWDVQIILWSKWQTGVGPLWHGGIQHRPDSAALKKTQWGFYMQELGGYGVVMLNIPIVHCGGMASFYWKFLQFAVDENHQYIPNVVSFHLAMGDKR